MNDENAASRPTLLDVARAAGVSRTTASNAFNRPDQLSKGLRDRVLKLAQEMGYAGPDPLARMLRRGTTRTIGLLFSDSLSYAVSDPAAVAMLRGVAVACERHAAGLLLLPLDRPETGDDAVARAAVDGFIVYCFAGSEPPLATVRRRNLPVVAVDFDGMAGAPIILVDDRGGALAAGRHVADLGHRRVAIIALDTGHGRGAGPVPPERLARLGFVVERERIAGYMEGLRSGGVEAEIAVYEEPSNAPGAAAALARTILEAEPRPTAILAMSDQLALGVLQAAAALGLAVPDDLSVVGFDDAPVAAFANPPLTTVRQPLGEKGRLAAETLLTGAKGPSRRVLPTELVVRRSSGPAPAG